MLRELGYFSVLFAFAFTLIQAILPIFLFHKKNLSVFIVRFSAILQSVLMFVSFFALVFAFLKNDFSILYVANNSNTHLSLLYRICAAWGAHEGSLLLWVLILSLWGAAVAIFSRAETKILMIVLGVMGAIGAGFYLFLITTSNPFIATPSHVLQHGSDLNPLLQDFGLAIHPPILYLGYVGFSVVFAFAIAALITARCDAAWIKWVRPWAYISWCFLTLGIVFGSWWSYRELGWGGVWAWDPVENASLMPWLAATALFHALSITEKTHGYKMWTLLLALLPFTLSLLGTFLVRSGILISIHAFALDSKRGQFLLYYLMAVLGLSFLLYAIRSKKMISRANFPLISRETLLLCNTMIFFVALMTVLLGTVYPLIINLLGIGNLSVGAPYFNTVFFPIAILMLILMALVPIFQSPLKNISMTLSHTGFVLMIISVLFSTEGIQKNVSLKIGENVQIGEYQVVLNKVIGIKNPDYISARAALSVIKHHHLIAMLFPELRFFPNSDVIIPKSAISISLFRDFYIALDGHLSHHRWIFLIAEKPWVRWIWTGGVLMIIGVFLALVNHANFKE